MGLPRCWSAVYSHDELHNLTHDRALRASENGVNGIAFMQLHCPEFDISACYCLRDGLLACCASGFEHLNAVGALEQSLRGLSLYGAGQHAASAAQEVIMQPAPLLRCACAVRGDALWTFLAACCDFCPQGSNSAVLQNAFNRSEAEHAAWSTCGCLQTLTAN